MKSDDINAKLDSLGIPYDPESHWKKREKLLNEAKETLAVTPKEEAGDETGTAPVVDLPVPDPEPVAENPPVAKTAPAKEGDEPQWDKRLGDKDPAAIAWRRKNWTKEQFQKRYPNL